MKFVSADTYQMMLATQVRRSQRRLALTLLSGRYPEFRRIRGGCTRLSHYQAVSRPQLLTASQVGSVSFRCSKDDIYCTGLLAVGSTSGLYVYKLEFEDEILTWTRKWFLE